VRIAEVDILVQPGLGNSGPGHWQRRWGERLSTARFVEQADWDHPRLDPWVERLTHEIMMSTRPVVIIAHSLGVSAVVHAARRLKDTKVRGALLVSPLDHEAVLPPGIAREIDSFGDVPRDPLPFPSLLVMSGTDPYGSVDHAADKAAAWGADLHLAGDAGHIDVASGHGPWPEGLLMFTRLMQRLKA
jgi:predicted alpha/beta hydrolase family esterase